VIVCEHGAQAACGISRSHLSGDESGGPAGADLQRSGKPGPTGQGRTGYSGPRGAVAAGAHADGPVDCRPPADGDPGP